MAISLSDVRFSYPDTPDKIVIDLPHWNVIKGERVFLQGESGCGKSSLLHLLAGLQQPQSGEIVIFDQKLSLLSKSKKDRFRANNIGFIFQQFNLIPYLGAIDNIRTAAYFSNKNPQKNRLAEKITSLLNKLNLPENLHDRPVNKLSIGQQQRVAIARALINQPPLVLADEPTSALDENNRNNFMASLIEVTESYNATLVFVSHDKTLMRYFSRTDSLRDLNQA